MSLPLCVEPSPKTCTSSSRIARTIAVVVTARPSGVVLKYFLPPELQVKRAALDRDQPLAHHRLAAVDEARLDRAVLAGHRRDVGRVRLVGLRQVGGVGVDLQALLRQPGDGAARVEAAGEGDAEASALGRKLAVDSAHGRQLADIRARVNPENRCGIQ